MTTEQNDNKCTGMEVPVIGISRHRIGIDGKGITTLVAFHGCSLQCKYCLNPEALGPDKGLPRYTPESLYEAVKIDDIYFRITGGGICFGGGEPLLRADFILRFRELCPKEWKISVETSLNVDEALVGKVAPVIDQWIIDTKAERSVAYKEYTGVYRNRFVRNLYLLTSGRRLNIPKERITLRVPVIPGYVSEEQAVATAGLFREEGFENVEVFRYVTDRPERETLVWADNAMGKDKCELFKSIRRELSRRNGIDVRERECSHKGDCPGTCPLCDYELKSLTEKLAGRGTIDYQSVPEIDEKLRQLESLYNNENDTPDIEGDMTPNPHGGQILQGEAMPPEEIPLMGIPISPRKKVLFKECAVAGVSFHLKYDDELWNELEAGQEVALVRDRRNKHDRNAVAVALAEDYDGDPDDFDFDFILGYVPRTENEEIAMMLDMGWNDVFYTTLSTVKTHGNLNDRLRISIFIQSKEPNWPEALRLYTPPLPDWVEMLRDLEDRGTAHFRWGGFPVWEHNLPKVGNGIVVMHEIGSEVVMFLMRVIAKGDDCIPFVADPERVNAADDCVSFVLANVCGPVTVDKSELAFLRTSEFKFDYEHEIYRDDSETLKGIFHKVMWKFGENNIDIEP